MLKRPKYVLQWMLLLSLAIHVGIILSINVSQRVNVNNRWQKSILQVTLKHLDLPETHAALNQGQPIAQEANPLPEEAEGKAELSPTIAISEKKYYTVKELDIIPRPIKTINPDYPATLPPFIHGGIVRLQLLLNEKGDVTEVTVLDSSPPGYFEDAAREAFINARFTPGIKAGKEVPSLLKLKIKF